MQKKKKGFTLVELLVVIAILAILAGVSVVGYLSFTEKAKESNDLSLITQLNTLLDGEEISIGHKPNTMHEALEAVEKGGFSVEKITPTSSKNEFIWNQDKNEFIIVPVEELNAQPSNPNNWLIVDNKEELAIYTERYSVYLSSHFNENIVEVKNGFDSGNIESIQTVNYTNNLEQSVVLRTNSFDTTLNINNDKANVKHYGDAFEVNVNAVANNSYHEFGSAKGINVKAGRVVIESIASVQAVIVTPMAGSNVVIDAKTGVKVFVEEGKDNSTVNGTTPETFNPTEGDASAQKYFAGGLGTETNPYIIETKTHFENIDKLYEVGSFYYSIKNNLQALDLNGLNSPRLNGSFNGNNVILSNVTDHLFEYVEGTIKNFTANMQVVEDCAALVYKAQNIRLENVVINGYLEGITWAASFVGFGMGSDLVHNYEFINCRSNATITATSGSASGFIGHPYCDSKNSTYKVENSKFNGILVAKSSSNCMYFNTNYWDLNVNVSYEEGFDVVGLYTKAPTSTDAFSGVVNFGSNVKYLKEVSTISTGKITLPNKGEILTLEKDNNTVKAVAYLIISPNKAGTETGSYTGTYMQEEMIIEGSILKTSNIKYFDIAINAQGATQTGVSGNTFNIVNDYYGHTHNGAVVKVVEYNSQGIVLRVSSVTIATKTGK